METVESNKKVAEAHIAYSAINWVNHCTYGFKILSVDDGGMAVKIERNEQVIYADRLLFNKPVTVKVGGDNGAINAILTATPTTFKLNGNLEESNLVLTNMIVAQV